MDMLNLLDREPRRVVAIAYTAILDSYVLDPEGGRAFAAQMAWPEQREQMLADELDDIARQNQAALGHISWAEPVE